MIKRRLVLIVVLFAAILVGCSRQGKEVPVTVHSEVYDTTVSDNSVKPKIEKQPDSDGEQPKANVGEDDKAGEDIKATDNVDESEEKDSSIVTPAPSSVDEPGTSKLDIDLLDKLDNKRYSWWISMNKQSSTPTIPSYARNLISKYDGVYVGDTSKKVIYLTFDEGYENGYTSSILDTLKVNDVKALFFVTGPYIKYHGALVERMVNDGHLVGNHTVNHPSLPSVSNDVLENELYGLEKQFIALTGEKFKYMRPPMGEYSERVLAASQQLGYKTIFWSFAYRDFEVNNQKGADHAYNMVMNNLHDGAIILLHAVSKDNAEALDRIIKGIREKGYEIAPFDL
ncbi:MAG: delta-lactam-biosynthetic de-N-acetylase [Clostridia bacterium]|nr:delta-lactam-biosynthetic de-N-acetylase [Clostridia bacterium]